MGKMLDPMAVATACQCTAHQPNVTANLPILATAMTKYGYHPELHTNLWIAVLATVAVETAHQFAPIAEMGSSEYLQSQTYWPFIGRGFVQTTWQNNYQEVADALDIDCVAHPELLLEPVNAANALMIFYTDRPALIAAAHDANWRETRRLVNGGYNGWPAYSTALGNLIHLAQS